MNNSIDYLLQNSQMNPEGGTFNATSASVVPTVPMLPNEGGFHEVDSIAYHHHHKHFV
jgi:hypothetical protein